MCEYSELWFYDVASLISQISYVDFGNNTIIHGNKMFLAIHHFAIFFVMGRHIIIQLENEGENIIFLASDSFDFLH